MRMAFMRESSLPLGTRPTLLSMNRTVHAMPIDADELLPRKKKVTEIELGADLSAMSEHELETRIALMNDEIGRCRDAIKARQATKDAAQAFFKKT